MTPEAGLPKGFVQGGRPWLSHRTGNACRYAGIRVVEFTHMVMGPTCGMVLADLGAEVIKVEPIAGDNTRRLLGSGAGFFPTVQPQQEEHRARPASSPKAREAALRLIATADIVSENFKPGTMKKLGLDYASLSQAQPAPHLRQPQGLPARPLRPPHRARRSGADDGRPGLHDRPRRRSAARRHQRQRHHGRHVRRHRRDGRAGASASTPARGQEVQSALFENNVFLVAQHMMQFAVTGKPAAPDAQPHLGLGASTTCSP